jgi:hypothetical protein
MKPKVGRVFQYFCTMERGIGVGRYQKIKIPPETPDLPGSPSYTLPSRRKDATAAAMQACRLRGFVILHVLSVY